MKSVLMPKVSLYLSSRRLRHRLKRAAFAILLMFLAYTSVRFLFPPFTDPSQNETPLRWFPEPHMAGGNLPSERVHSKPYEYLINPREVCCSEAPVDYLFLVLSAPEYVDRRNAIRRTWAKDVKGSSGNKVLFLLGKPDTDKLQSALELESLGYGDVVQENFSDTYRNLSLKSVMLLRWASLHCPQARFVVKIDDDCFPNLANFYRAMHGQPNDAIYGELLHKHIPSRDPLDKWYVPYEELPADVFPDYIHGAMYVIGGRVVALLYRATGHVRPVSMEDVYITGMCTELAGIGRTRLAGTSNKRLSTLCEYKTALYGHHVTAEEINKLWYAMKQLEYKCHRLFYSVHLCYCRAVDGAVTERIIEVPVL